MNKTQAPPDIWKPGVGKDLIAELASEPATPLQLADSFPELGKGLMSRAAAALCLAICRDNTEHDFQAGDEAVEERMQELLEEARHGHVELLPISTYKVKVSVVSTTGSSIDFFITHIQTRWYCVLLGSQITTRQ